MAMVSAIKEAIWLKSLEAELVPNSPKSLTLYCDNKGVIHKATNGAYSNRTKYIAIKAEFVKEKINNGQIQIKYIPTNNMPTDILTKIVVGTKHLFLAKQFGLV